VRLSRLIVLDRTKSTNSWILEHPEVQIPNTSVRALEQTAGRGRAGRSWFASGGQLDLTCSTVLPVRGALTPAVTVVAGFSVFKVIRRYAAVKIKWPNDILFAGQKLAGVLCEAVAGMPNIIVVGVGVNVNSTRFPDVLLEKATSLCAATGKTLSVQSLWIHIVRELCRDFRRLELPLGFQFIRDYNRHAETYVYRPEITGEPLQFETLLADGRGMFSAGGKMFQISMAE
jgi:biotin-[acetyl-CoA-carboxylase] ligase BirA-like protein